MPARAPPGALRASCPLTSPPAGSSAWCSRCAMPTRAPETGIGPVAPDVEVRTVPGITAMQDLAARTGVVLAEGAEPVVLMPYTAGGDALRAALDRGDTVVVYKGGRHLPRLLDALRASGRIDD